MASNVRTRGQERILEEDASFPANAPVPWPSEVGRPQVGRWHLAGLHGPNTMSLTPVPFLAGIPGEAPHLHGTSLRESQRSPGPTPSPDGPPCPLQVTTLQPGLGPSTCSLGSQPPGWDCFRQREPRMRRSSSSLQ